MYLSGCWAEAKAQGNILLVLAALHPGAEVKLNMEALLGRRVLVITRQRERDNPTHTRMRKRDNVRE